MPGVVTSIVVVRCKCRLLCRLFLRQQEERRGHFEVGNEPVDLLEFLWRYRLPSFSSCPAWSVYLSVVPVGPKIEINVFLRNNLSDNLHFTAQWGGVVVWAP